MRPAVLSRNLEAWHALPDVGLHVEFFYNLERLSILIDASKTVNEGLFELSAGF